MTTHRISLANGWTAEYTEQGEFRMGAVGWNLQLRGPEQQAIRYFETVSYTHLTLPTIYSV